MKQHLLIAGICAFVATSASAATPETQPTIAAMGASPGQHVSATETGTTPDPQLVPVKGSSQGCSATLGSGGDRKCGTKGASINFPVMIGVYR